MSNTSKTHLYNDDETDSLCGASDARHSDIFVDPKFVTCHLCLGAKKGMLEAELEVINAALEKVVKP